MGAERGWLRSQGRCLHWIGRGRCAASFCREDRSEHRWMDHTTGWTKDGERLLLCQPYHLYADEVRDLAEAAERFGLEVTVHGGSWYGNGTIAIELTCKAADDDG